MVKTCLWPQRKSWFQNHCLNLSHCWGKTMGILASDSASCLWPSSVCLWTLGKIGEGIFLKCCLKHCNCKVCLVVKVLCQTYLVFTDWINSQRSKHVVCFFRLVGISQLLGFDSGLVTFYQLNFHFSLLICKHFFKSVLKIWS